MAQPGLELIDASAWVEYLRGTGSTADAALAERIRRGAGVATTEPVRMELLAGARPHELKVLRRALASCRMIPVEPGDWEDAAAIYARCRGAGVTLRSLLDCLIAAVAIRVGVPVLAQERDFEQIARHAPLELATPATP